MPALFRQNVDQLLGKVVDTAPAWGERDAAPRPCDDSSDGQSYSLTVPPRTHMHSNDRWHGCFPIAARRSERAALNDVSRMKARAIVNARAPAFRLDRWVATTLPQRSSGGIVLAFPGQHVLELLRRVVDLTLGVVAVVCTAAQHDRGR